MHGSSSTAAAVAQVLFHRKGAPSRWVPVATVESAPEGTPARKLLSTVLGNLSNIKKERASSGCAVVLEAEQVDQPESVAESGAQRVAVDIARCTKSRKFEAQAMAAARVVQPQLLERSCVPRRVQSAINGRPNMAAVIAAVPGHASPFSATPPLQRRWYRLLGLATADHDWNLDKPGRQRAALPCMSVLLEAVHLPATSSLFPQIGTYRAWHILRSARHATGCPAYPMWAWPGMSGNTKHAAAALAACGVHNPAALHEHIARVLPSLARLAQCGMAAELLLCSAHSAWRQHGSLDVASLAAVGVTGSVAMAEWAAGQRRAGVDPEHDVGGALVDASDLLGLVVKHPAWSELVAAATRPTPVPFLAYLCCLLEHAWLPKADLNNCPDVIACHAMYTVVRHRGWDHRDAIRWTVAAHELWFPSRAMAALAHVPWAPGHKRASCTCRLCHGASSVGP